MPIKADESAAEDAKEAVSKETEDRKLAISNVQDSIKSATSNQAGLMSASDKAKLDSLQIATTYKPITGAAGLTKGAQYRINDSYLARVIDFPDAGTAVMMVCSCDGRNDMGISGGSPGCSYTAIQSVINNSSGAVKSHISSVANVTESNNLYTVYGNTVYDSIIYQYQPNKSYGHSERCNESCMDRTIKTSNDDRWSCVCYKLALDGLALSGTTIYG